MKMTGLKPLYDDMLKSEQKYVVFPFAYNKKDYSCLFSIYSKPFRLQIATVGINPKLLVFDVLPGFLVKTYLDSADYSQLVSILGIQYDEEHVFKPGEFLRVLNDHLPASCADAKKRERAAVKERRESLDSEGRDIFLSWYQNPPDKGVRSKNYEKTKRSFGKENADYLREIRCSTRWTGRKPQEKKIR